MRKNVPLNLLLVDGSSEENANLKLILEGQGYESVIENVSTYTEFREHLKGNVDAVLSESDTSKNLRLLSIIKAENPGMPFIVISKNNVPSRDVIDEMKAGVSNYAFRDDLKGLGATIEKEIKAFHIYKKDLPYQQELKERADRYRSLWENSRDALMLVTDNKIISVCNPAVETIFGYPSEALNGLPLSTIQPADKFKDIPLLVDYIEMDKDEFNSLPHFETQALHKDGHTVDIEFFVDKFTLNGKPVTTLTIRDITEWKRTQAEQIKNKEQIRIAQQIHKKLYPETYPDFHGYDIAGISYPAEEIGGDYFDFFEQGRNSLDIVIGDVSGHGLGPAILMAETRAYLRVLSRNREYLNEILTRTNQVLVEDMDANRYVTLTLLRLISRPSAFIYANAGHTPGFIIGLDGQVRQKLTRTGIVLGRKADTIYKQSEYIALEEGDILVLLTDGMQEIFSPDGEMFGTERIIKTIHENRERPSKEIIEALYKAGTDFSQTPALDDDFTCIIIKVKH